EEAERAERFPSRPPIRGPGRDPQRGHPGTVPGPDRLIEGAPALDPAVEGSGSGTGTVLAALVALDQAARQQAGERDAEGVLLDAEEAPGRHQGPHRHRPAPQRREEVEDQALGRRPHRAAIITLSGHPKPRPVIIGAIPSCRDDDAEARKIGAAPLLVEEIGVARALDLPPPTQFDVVVVVVGPDPDTALLAGVEEVVVESPAAARRGCPGQLDLRVSPMVYAESPGLPAERLGEEAHDRLHPLEAVAPLAVVDRRIGREAPRELVPQLQVEAPPVAVLQPLDRLDVLERLDAALELARPLHGSLPFRLTVGRREQ